LELNISILDVSMHITTNNITKWYVFRFYSLLNQYQVSATAPLGSSCRVEFPERGRKRDPLPDPPD